MNTSESDIIPLHKLQPNKWYQLANPIVISPSRSWNTDISEAVASLYHEPHELEAIYGTKGRGGVLTEITVQFAKTDADRNTNRYRNFPRNYWHINSRQELPDGWNTLFIDLEAREKMYAPPSENGSNTGGLFYHLGKKRFETLVENPTLAPPYNREGINQKYEKNPTAFKNFLKSTTNSTTSSTKLGGKQRKTRKSSTSLQKNKRKQTRKYRLKHLYKFFKQ